MVAGSSRRRSGPPFPSAGCSGHEGAFSFLFYLISFARVSVQSLIGGQRGGGEGKMCGGP
jgi:hypothetical protein